MNGPSFPLHIPTLPIGVQRIGLDENSTPRRSSYAKSHYFDKVNGVPFEARSPRQPLMSEPDSLSEFASSSHSQQAMTSRHTSVFMPSLAIPSQPQPYASPSTYRQQPQPPQSQASAAFASPRLTARQAPTIAQPPVLRFYGYFKESVVESPLERERVRRVTVLFYTEDDTIHVSEQQPKNSGIMGGALISRQRIPNPSRTGPAVSGLSAIATPRSRIAKEQAGAVHYTVHYFNIGSEVSLYGKVIRLVDCDEFSRKYLMETVGHSYVPEAEQYPDDEYSQRTQQLVDSRNKKPTAEDREFKRHGEMKLTGRASFPSHEEKELMQSFLANDKQVLRFYAYWDDRSSQFGDVLYLVVHYFLKDESIEILEGKNGDGRQSFPVFLKKGRLYRPDAPSDHYREADLHIGGNILALSRKLVLYDCDQFTREYYNHKYGITDFTPCPPPKHRYFEIKEQYLHSPRQEPPPYNGFGSEEDSLGNCGTRVVLKPPKKDVKKLLDNDGETLRFKAKFANSHPDDVHRSFIIACYPADDSVLIYEPIEKNSGLLGGKFLQRQRIKNPATGRYFTADDMKEGSVVTILSHRFLVTETEEHAKKVMLGTPRQRLSGSELSAVLKRIRDYVTFKNLNLKAAFRRIDSARSGGINFSAFKRMCEELMLPLSDADIATLMRTFASGSAASANISYHDFLAKMEGVSDLDAGSTRRDSIQEQVEDPSLYREIEKQKDFERRRAQLLATFKRKLLEHHDGHNGLWRALNLKKDQSLEIFEFQFAIKNVLRFSFSKDELDILTDYFFRDGATSIDLNTFRDLYDSAASWGFFEKA